MEDRYLVAIDLGSSKLAITVARTEGNNVHVVYYHEHESEGVDKSAILNEAKLTRALKAAIERAESELGIKIRHAAVCMPRKDIKVVTSQAEIVLDPDKAITIDDVQELMKIAKENCGIENEDSEAVYSAVAQSYSDGEDFQISEQDIIGNEREKLEGNFKIFVGKKTGLKRLNKVFSDLGITPISVFTANSTARTVLSSGEMDSGVALVEIGAGVSSVTIYVGGVLRYYGSIPFGGKIITSDIRQECGIGESLAENIKKGYGICLPSKLQHMSEKKLQIRSANGGNDKQIPVKFLSEIITARMGEICDAMLYLIQESGLYDELRSGIVITGGGACIANCANLFSERSGYNVKIGYPVARFEYGSDCDGVHETSAASSLGMILEAKEMSEINYADEGRSEGIKVGETYISNVRSTGTYIPPFDRPAAPKIEPEATPETSRIFEEDEDERRELEKIAKREAEEKEKKRKEQEEERKMKAAKAKEKTKEKANKAFGFLGKLFAEDDDNGEA